MSSFGANRLFKENFALVGDTEGEVMGDISSSLLSGSTPGGAFMSVYVHVEQEIAMS